MSQTFSTTQSLSHVHLFDNKLFILNSLKQKIYLKFSNKDHHKIKFQYIKFDGIEIVLRIMQAKSFFIATGNYFSSVHIVKSILCYRLGCQKKFYGKNVVLVFERNVYNILCAAFSQITEIGFTAQSIRTQSSERRCWPKNHCFEKYLTPYTHPQKDQW